ncbi:MAG TPA: cyclopropane-fatty-acyl-phospholipid synthase family protein [Frankiaceae bacterium]|nr:cyclopropane-fatty-acyl-phospholipid synthase family protein [Frankiaceae bacterium]
MNRTPVAELLSNVLGNVPVGITAYDGSTAGPSDAVVRVRVNSPKALTYLIFSPGQLGLPRAYVSGELDIEGDLYAGIGMVFREHVGEVSLADKINVLRNVDPKALRWVDPPPEEYNAKRPLQRLSQVRAGLTRHSKKRDAQVIGHHYDISNRFYELVLGPSMAYTCAAYPELGSSLEEAQYAKHDLVARKLGLKPGMRLLDVGCGWGGMVRHAAKHYGVQVIGVTLSRQQAEWGAKAIAEQGLSELAEIRHCDYRDVPETGFDAVSSIGLTEHIGVKNVPGYFRFLQSKLRPQGRILNHCITRPRVEDGAAPTAGFIDRYVFPDGELSSVATIAGHMQSAGLEVRHEESLREHYALTLRDWCANLAAHRDEAVAEVGEATTRVWEIYMTGSRLGFEKDAVELHQVLGVNSVDGVSGMPVRPDWGV